MSATKNNAKQINVAFINSFMVIHSFKSTAFFFFLPFILIFPATVAAHNRQILKVSKCCTILRENSMKSGYNKLRLLIQILRALDSYLKVNLKFTNISKYMDYIICNRSVKKDHYFSELSYFCKEYMRAVLFLLKINLTQELDAKFLKNHFTPLFLFIKKIHQY